MTIKEIHAKAGSLSYYVWYILLLFVWDFLQNVYTAAKPIFPGNSVEPFIFFLLSLAIPPLLLGGVLGGIHAQQRSQSISGIGRFLTIARTHYWRILSANLFYLAFFFLIVIVASVSGLLEPSVWEDKKTLAYISVPFSAISLFWLAAIVVERKIVRGLARTMRTLLFSPFALLLGIVWGTIQFADTVAIDVLDERLVVALTGIAAGIFSFAKVGASAYALAIYKKARVEFFQEPSEESPILAPSSASPGDSWARASFALTFVAFLPLVHLAALILGVVALKRKKQFVMKASIACCVGGFFTFFYLLLTVGWFVGRATPSRAPGYTFLIEANPELSPYVRLLEQRLFSEIPKELERANLNTSERHWTFDYVSAMAKSQTHDLKDALADFRVAVGKKPERSEFYYYYGRVLLNNKQEEQAAEQFQIALEHEPKLADAERFLALIHNAYTPSTIVSSLWFIIVLLILFPFHEYGHAFAAWKLGDDTAKSQGRLTLNPFPHLDIFGSVILPGILLWQQSDVIFGWAKPVPVNPENFANPRQDHIYVSFAGPAVNLVISMLCFVILGCLMLCVRIFWPESLALDFATPSSSVSLIGPPFASWLVIIVAFLKKLFYTSLVLGCFNLIPIPPLDGSWIFSGLLPQGVRNLFEMTRQYGFVIFLLLVMTSVLNYLLAIPIGLAWGLLYLCVAVLGFG